MNSGGMRHSYCNLLTLLTLQNRKCITSLKIAVATTDGFWYLLAAVRYICFFVPCHSVPLVTGFVLYFTNLSMLWDHCSCQWRLSAYQGDFVPKVFLWYQPCSAIDLHAWKDLVYCKNDRMAGNEWLALCRKLSYTTLLQESSFILGNCLLPGPHLEYLRQGIRVALTGNAICIPWAGQVAALALSRGSHGRAIHTLHM